jgi:hypothetical protein
MGGTSIGAAGTGDRKYNPSGSGKRAKEWLSDTLLGPEGTGQTDPSRPTPESLVLPGVSVGALVRGCTARLAGVSTAWTQESRPYLENCTVDASI